MKIRTLLSTIIVISTLHTDNLSAQTGAENFEDGSLSPFIVEKVTGNISEIITPTSIAARSGSKVHRIVWQEENYNGQRSGRSVEGTSYNLPRITGDGWYGFSFYAPESFPVPGKRMALGQIICWHPSLPSTSATIGLIVNEVGEVILDGAYGIGDGGRETTVFATLAPQLTKGVWHDVIIYCKFSRANTGILRAWYDGAPENAPTAEYTGINLGNGGWINNELMTNGGYIKWGPYCWDYPNYTPGESREIFYDEITYQTGNPTGAFELVKPNGYGSGYLAPAREGEIKNMMFDALATGSWPSGWSAVSDSGTGLSIRATPSTTDKSIRLYDGNNNGKIEAWEQFEEQSQPFSARWTFLQTGNGVNPGQGHFMALLNDGQYSVQLTIVNGNLVYTDGSGTAHVVEAAPVGSWHRVELIVDPEAQTTDVYFNGVRKLSSMSFQSAANSFDTVLFGTSDESASTHFYIDDIFISGLAPVFHENFDTMTTGSKPLDWVSTNDSSTSVSVRATPSNADKSIRFWDDNSSGSVNSWKSFVPQRNVFTASWQFMETGNTPGHFMELLSADRPAITLLSDGNGNLVFRNVSGSDTTLVATPANSWHQVDLAVDTDTGLADVFVNGTLRLADAPLRNSVPFIDRLSFGSSNATTSKHLFVDDVFIDR